MTERKPWESRTAERKMSEKQMTLKEEQSFDKNSEYSRTVKSKERTKRELVIQYYINNPRMNARQIARKAKTSVGYVWNILSKYKREMSSERWGSKRLYGGVRGLSFFEDAVLPEWYDELGAPVVNSRTGMKQIGLKSNGDPCSLQIHRNGRVIIFTHALGWQDWLVDRLMECGWAQSRGRLLVDNCRLTVKVLEAGVKVPKGIISKDLIVKTTWGFMLVRDDSPTKNTLEVKISVPDLERYLGLPEIRKKLQLLVQGGLTHEQLLRAALALLIQNEKTRRLID